MGMTGPGTNLATLLRQHGVPDATCVECQEWIALMDRWGPEGCRTHMSIIESMLTVKARELTLAQTAKVGILLMLNGEWPTIHSLVDRAIEMAESDPTSKVM